MPASSSRATINPQVPQELFEVFGEADDVINETVMELSRIAGKDVVHEALVRNLAFFKPIGNLKN